MSNGVQDKFLAGLGGVTLVGCAVLGYFIWKANTTFTESAEAFNAQANSYNALRSQPLALTEENLVKLQGQTQLVTDTAAALQKRLAGLTFPKEEITPEQFQDRLQATVAKVVQKARTTNTKLPENFYLGFDQYAARPPASAIAPLLLRQLKAVDLAVNVLLDNRIVEIRSIARAPLPGEAAAAPAAGGKAAVAPVANTSPLVVRYPFEIELYSNQVEIRRSLNDLVKNTQQYFVVRPLSIRNDGKESVKREVAGAATPAPAGAVTGTPTPAPAAAQAANAAATPQGEGGARQLSYIVGTEKLDVRLRLEMIVFDTPFPQQ